MVSLLKENDKFRKWTSSGMLCNPTMLYSIWQALSTTETKWYGIVRRHLSASALELEDLVHIVLAILDSPQVFSDIVNFSTRDAILALTSISRKLYTLVAISNGYFAKFSYEIGKYRPEAMDVVCLAIVISLYTRLQNFVAFSCRYSVLTTPKRDCDFRVARGSRKRWRILSFGNTSVNGTKIFSGMRIVLRIMYFEALHTFFIIRAHFLVASFKLILFVLWFMHIRNSLALFPLLKNPSVKKGRGRFSKLHWNISFRTSAAISRKFVNDLKK